MKSIEISTLAEQFEDRCRLVGDFVLASGQRSSYYFDAKAGLLAADLKVDLALALWKLVGDVDFDVVGGQAVGAVPMAEHMSVVAAYERGEKVDTFYVREAPKSHGLRQDVFQARTSDGGEILKQGTRVLILDDVLTTGGSLQIAIKAVQNSGATIAAVAVLVDRQDEKAAWLRDDPLLNFRALFDADGNGRLKPSPRKLVTA